MKTVLPWLLFACLLIADSIVFFEQSSDAREAEKAWDIERDSLNAALKELADSLQASASQHFTKGDSLDRVPPKTYLDHAQRTTHSADLDSLGRMFWADPFVVAPER